MAISHDKLVNLRKARGWSQEKLAAISGVSERTIQRAERDGTCSLETQMAIATTLDVSPVALARPEEGMDTSDILYKTSWGAAVGLFTLGLTAPLVVLLTAQNGQWEVVSFLTVAGVTIALSLTNYGAKPTYQLFDKTSWLIRYPSRASGLNRLIVHAKSVIEYAYIVGVVSSLVAWLTMKTHQLTGSDTETVFLALRPFVYTILFVELWFRPYKKKLEYMLIQQGLYKERQ